MRDIYNNSSTHLYLASSRKKSLLISTIIYRNYSLNTISRSLLSRIILAIALLFITNIISSRLYSLSLLSFLE
jgi:hypothetical protein